MFDVAVDADDVVDEDEVVDVAVFDVEEEVEVFDDDVDLKDDMDFDPSKSALMSHGILIL